MEKHTRIVSMIRPIYLNGEEIGQEVVEKEYLVDGESWVLVNETVHLMDVTAELFSNRG